MSTARMRKCARGLALVIVLAACRRGEPSRATNRNVETQTTTLMTFASLVYAAGDVATADERTALAGYQLDYAQSSTSELDRTCSSRPLLAAAVHAWPLELKREALAFFLANPQWSTMYTSLVVESFGPSPAFTPNGFHGIGRWSSPDAEAALSRLLARAFEVGAHAKLWDQLAVDWQHHQLAPARVEELERRTLDYLRWDARIPLPKVTVIVDPLMPSGTGTNVVLGGDELVLVQSVWLRREDVELTFVHEFLHAPIQRLEDHRPALASALSASADAYRAVTSNYGYATWPSYLNENVIRCLSYRVMGVADRNTGFVFEPHISRRLRDYERGTGSFDAFLIEMLGELPAAARAARARD